MTLKQLNLVVGLKPSLTDANGYGYGGICPVNICPGHICPYQEYFSCHLPNFYQTLKAGFWEHLEQIQPVMVTFVQVTFVHIRNILAVTYPILTKP